MMLGRILLWPAVAVLLLAITHAAAGAERFRPGSPDENAIRAFAMAYRHFSDTLIDETGTKGDPEILAFVSSMTNYKVEFVEMPEEFKITFGLQPYHGRLLYGGGAEYTVSKSTGDLKLVERYE
jgi:hypothetical protein